MKKCIVLLFIFLFSIINTFSTDLTDIRTGEYVFYYDYRGKPHYTGYIFIRDENK